MTKCINRKWWSAIPEILLTVDDQEARAALSQGRASAVFDCNQKIEVGERAHLSFDWDSTLVDDEGDLLIGARGRDAFAVFEYEHRNVPHKAGPLYPLLIALQDLPVDISIITARTAHESHRVIATLLHWGVQVDALHFCANRPKGPIAKAIGAHIHFDDIWHHVANVEAFGVAGAWVPYGAASVVNDQLRDKPRPIPARTR